MIELRRHVERIVRPIRASATRKVRMREELLAHLTQMYEEELAAQGDRSTALAAAQVRFGDPAELRQELQGTVTWIEQVMCTRLETKKNPFGRRPGEATLAFIRRTALWGTIINAALWMTFVGFVAIAGPRRAQEARPGGMLVLVVAYVLLFPLLVYGPLVLCDRSSRAWQSLTESTGRDRLRFGLRLIGFLLATMAVYTIGTLVFLTLFNRATTISIVSNFWFWGITLAAGLVGLPITLFQVRDQRRWERWEGLVIDE